MKKIEAEKIVEIYSSNLYPNIVEIAKIIGEEKGVENNNDLKLVTTKILYSIYEELLGEFVFKNFPERDKTGREW